MPVAAVSSLPPASGIAELADAFEQHRAGLDLPARRLRSRRLCALREFTVEHGERALRALGGRREAQRLLAEQGPDEDVNALIAALERQLEGAA